MASPIPDSSGTSGGIVATTGGGVVGGAAAADIFSMLRPDDRISVVVFHSVGEVLLPSTLMGDADLVAVGDTLASMQAQGTTAMTSGLQLGLAQVQSNRTAESLNWIVLLGDGVPNDPGSIPGLAQSAGSQNIPIAAIGLGLAYDEALMGQVAQLSGGHFEYVERAEAVATVFRNEVLRLENVLARNTILSLQPGPGVELIEVVGQQTPGGGGALQLHLGDIAEGETRELVVRMTAPARRSGTLVELLDATLHFEDAYTQAGLLERRLFFGARSSESDAAIAATRNEGVFETAATLQAAATTLQAIQMVRMGRVDEATAMLQAVRGHNRSYEALDDLLPSSDSDAPSAAPAQEEMESSIRRAHSEAMEALGY